MERRSYSEPEPESTFTRSDKAAPRSMSWTCYLDGVVIERLSQEPYLRQMIVPNESRDIGEDSRGVFVGTIDNLTTGRARGIHATGRLSLPLPKTWAAGLKMPRGNSS